MAARRQKITYDIDDNSELFIAPTWPELFLKDPAYALFRPLYDSTSPWRKNHSMLVHYLNGQARRLGGRQYILFHFANIARISRSYTNLHGFLADPFTNKHQISLVFSDLEKFLRWRFDTFSHDPWEDLVADEQTAASKGVSDKDLELIPITLSDADRKKILKKELSKIPWQVQLQRSLEYDSGMEGFHTSLIENAIKECPDLLQQKSNEDLVQQIFSSPTTSALSLELGSSGYVTAEIPVMLGSHYLSKKAQKIWFDSRGKKFYRILGCYARWDDATVVIFKHTVHDDSQLQRNMFAEIKEKMALVSVGTWKKAQVDGLDYYLSLLVDADMPVRAFFVSEWELNCPNLLIKDTEVCH
jgi:hypothetical protein